MKKSFYFALALTAGLFASCSSDDLTADAPQQPGIEVNDNDAVQIQIGVGSPVVTRGTGSVGTTDIGATTTNGWQGQKFNLFMFKKGTFIPASYIDPETNKNVEVYNDTEMTAKRGSTMAQQLDENGIEQFNYFPNSTTPYSFWAYRLDDAWVDAAGKAGWEEGADATTKVVNGVVAYAAGATTYTWDTTTEATEAEQGAAVDKTGVAGWAPGAEVEGVEDTWYKYTTATGVAFAKCTAVNVGAGGYGDDDPAVTKVEIPFKINGSQDIMIAETKESDAATKLLTEDSKTTTMEQAADRIYTAYAARRGVYPDLVFKHQLARLYFEIKAYDRQVSEAADKKTSDPNEYPGFKITGISVWSKNSGTLVAAYKGTDEPTRITWNDGVEELKVMQRASTTVKADVKMAKVAVGATVIDFSVQTPAISSDYYENASTAITASMLFYDTADKNDETGEPSGTAKTMAEWQAEATPPTYVYYAAAKKGDHEDAAHTPWSKALETTDDSLNLVALAPVTLKWENYTPATTGADAWQEIPKKFVSATWKTLNAAEIAALTDAQKTAAKAADHTLTTAPDENTEGVKDNYYYRYDFGVEYYYQCTSVTYNIDGAVDYGDDKELADIVADATADKAKVYYSTQTTPAGIKYFKYGATSTPVNEGNTVATRIGESLLVAPSDAADGLKVKVYFKRCKKLTGSKVQELPGESEFMIKSKDGAFKANSRYKVTAIMYQDGAAQPGNVTLGDEDDGETEDEDYDL